MKELRHWVLKPIIYNLFISLSFIYGCQGTSNRGSTYERILDYFNEILVVNTHEHQREPVEYRIDTVNFCQLLLMTYLMQDLVSAGVNRLETKELSSKTLEYQWNTLGGFLDLSRNTSYYGQFIKGFQKLYDFDEMYFTESNIKGLSAQVVSNYSDFDSWFSTAFKKAGYEIMFNDQFWKPFNVDIDTRYFALVFHINAIVLDICKRPEPGGDFAGTYEQANKDGFEINSLTDYLNYCDFLFQKNADRNAVCIKNSMAYGRLITMKCPSMRQCTCIKNHLPD